MTKPFGWHRRKNDRVMLAAEILLGRTGDGLSVRVFDVSPSGCKLAFADAPQLADKVWVRFAGLEPLEAWVCWIEGLAAGVEFKTPIHPRVFDLLTQRLAS